MQIIVAGQQLRRFDGGSNSGGNDGCDAAGGGSPSSGADGPALSIDVADLPALTLPPAPDTKPLTAIERPHSLAKALLVDQVHVELSPRGLKEFEGIVQVAPDQLPVPTTTIINRTGNRGSKAAAGVPAHADKRTSPARAAALAAVMTSVESWVGW